MKTSVKWAATSEVGELFVGSSPLSRIERGVLGALLGIGLVVDVLLPSTGPDFSSDVFETALIASFGFFLHTPRVGSVIMLAAVAVSFPLAMASEALLSGALAVGLVARCGTRALVTRYVAIYVLLLLVAAVTRHEPGLGGTIMIIMIAGVALGVGALQRWAVTSEKRAVRQLVEREEQEEAVVHAERRRIADELHDVLAHDLTIIALHARVLERAPGIEDQRRSREAIAAAALKALTDLRWLLGQMDVLQTDASVAIGDLGSAVSDALGDLTAAGWVVALSGADLTSENLPRLVTTALARIVREAGTNTLKHASPGRAELIFVSERDYVGLRMMNDLDESDRHRLPPGGYGTVRMAERVRIVGGEIEVGERDGRWNLEVRVPRQIVVPTVSTS
ncbi:sensor histidine kinase [Rathayibacter sp. VKM Ac-2927]|uniref:sensor histidine kinase n=1 Tax=Rathayibacter sp. VKM Ac-2927 TaxID=2929478 RepID=UPI001FB2B13A|nr:histidine kinase [Rathayibacter sp. VKM Ac-2927]MCJ1685520.1 histidine kinase [Rathayibacter sp. VKM Ac-2927]